MSDSSAWPNNWTPKKVADKLATLRMEKTGLSRRAFADTFKLPVTYQTVNNIENGDQYPSLDTLGIWLEACHTSFHDFFEEDLPHRAYPYPKHLRNWLDQFAFVLSRLGPLASVAARTLQLEYNDLIAKARDEPDPAAGEG